MSLITQSHRSLVFSLILAGMLGSMTSTAHAAPQQDPESAILQWCNNTLYQLQTARMYAQNAQMRGQHGQAKQILLNALRNARVTASPWTNGPLTFKAIQRSLNIAQVIESSIPQNSVSDRTVVYFLFGAIKFVEQTAYTTDVQYYVPYYHNKKYAHNGCRNNCVDFDQDAHERALVKFAGDQINLVLNNLAYSREVVHPIGNPKAFLSALSTAARATAMDLSSSLYATYYACEIMQLEQLAARIASFAGTCGTGPMTAPSIPSSGEYPEIPPYEPSPVVFGDSFTAVQASYWEAREIANRISGAQHCGGYGY